MSKWVKRVNIVILFILSCSYTSYALMAPSFTSAGAAVAIVEYTLAPEVKLEDQINQVQRAVIYVCEWAKKRGSRYVFIED
jgi:acetyl esterase/lipase